jgi:hypothetical protein
MSCVLLVPLPEDHKDKTQYIILFGVQVWIAQNKTGESVWPIMQYSYQYPSDVPHTKRTVKNTSMTAKSTFTITIDCVEKALATIPTKK